jgi:hypothetical protein
MVWTYSTMYLWEDGQFNLVLDQEYATHSDPGNMFGYDRHLIVPIGGTNTPVYIHDGASEVGPEFQFGYTMFDPNGRSDLNKWDAYGYSAGHESLTPQLLVYEWANRGLGFPSSPDVFPTEVTYTSEMFTNNPPYYWTFSGYGWTKLVPASGVWEPGIYDFGEYACGENPGVILQVGLTTSFMVTPAVPEAASIIIWSLLGGLGIVFTWRKRKVA